MTPCTGRTAPFSSTSYHRECQHCIRRTLPGVPVTAPVFNGQVCPQRKEKL